MMPSTAWIQDLGGGNAAAVVRSIVADRIERRAAHVGIGHGWGSGNPRSISSDIDAIGITDHLGTRKMQWLHLGVDDEPRSGDAAADFRSNFECRTKNMRNVRKVCGMESDQ